MTDYDYLLPLGKSMANGIGSKPGVHFANKEMVADWIAQRLHKAPELTNLRARVARLEAALREILAVDSHGFGVPLGTRLKTMAMEALEDK